MSFSVGECSKTVLDKSLCPFVAGRKDHDLRVSS